MKNLKKLFLITAMFVASILFVSCSGYKLDTLIKIQNTDGYETVVSKTFRLGADSTYFFYIEGEDLNLAQLNGVDTTVIAGVCANVKAFEIQSAILSYYAPSNGQSRILREEKNNIEDIPIDSLLNSAYSY